MLLCHVVPALLFTLVRCGPWAGGHVLVELASMHDAGCFMLLCWPYSAPGDADRNGSRFSLGLSCSLAFLGRESDGGQEKTAWRSQG